MTTADIARFWKWVEKTEACWEWAGDLNGSGYGRFWLDGRTRIASRVSWAIHHAVIPRDVFVLHNCDNRRCVNPDHLFLGTARDNTHDMTSKGRQKWGHKTCGEDCKTSILRTQEVLAMREKYKAGGTTYQLLAHEYGVSRRTVAQAVRRETWRHV